MPASEERWAQRILARLEHAGLLAHVRPPAGPRRLWYATEHGARLALESGALDRPPKRLTARDALGQLQAHTLAVNDVGIYFLEAARLRGDEFGPLSWRHEVAHPLNRGRGARRRELIADAVITYLRIDKDELAVEQRFLEVDRATLPVDRLAAQLARYAQLHNVPGDHGQPAWRDYYPVFPPVVCVLAGAGRPALERRRDTTVALLATHPQLDRVPQLGVSFCLFEDLQRDGPFAAIFTDAAQPDQPVDWLGRRHGTSGHDRGRG